MPQPPIPTPTPRYTRHPVQSRGATPSASTSPGLSVGVAVWACRRHRSALYLGRWILLRDLSLTWKGTCRVKSTSSRPRLAVTADGRGVVGHAGTRMLADLADATGLSAALAEALAPLRQRDRGHEPGRVAVDLAVMLA